MDLMAIAQGVARQAETDKNCKGRETRPVRRATWVRKKWLK